MNPAPRPRLINRSEDFAEEMLSGLALAHQRHVRRVDGGVVRSTRVPDGQVALVIGGGSGHYPAFAGLVGPGLATGSACGNIFASPSAGQVYRVAKAAERGGGVLLSYGNYAGDVLHFGQAQERLRAEGIDVRTVVVTDDIASGPADQPDKRRGIAGDLTVFKIAGAAAEAGYDLDAVEAVARRANHRTRSLGVAFSGCTLPGATEPLFEVTPGMMAVGLGIHGEPGISEQPVPSADELAGLLVERLLGDRPADIPASTGQRVVAILNGLGTVKYEELFVVFRRVHELLGEAGIDVVEPESGELVTSLDMAGLSLTLFWLDDELERLWIAPADSPAYRKGAVSAEAETVAPSTAAAAADSRPVESAAHRAAAPIALELLTAASEMVVASADEFGRIDAIAGDGDHGIGMARGVTAALGAAERVVTRGGGVVEMLAEGGEAWSEHGGGTSGALWGIALTSAAASLSRETIIDDTAVARAATAALAAVQGLGKAEPGDKTMVDAFVPFVEVLARESDGGAPLAAAWCTAARAAAEAAEATAQLRPRLGRARPLAEKSIGHPDAGAVSFSRIVTTVGEQLSLPVTERNRV